MLLTSPLLAKFGSYKVILWSFYVKVRKLYVLLVHTTIFLNLLIIIYYEPTKWPVLSQLVNIVRLYFHSCLLSSVNYCNDGFYSFLDLLFSYNEYDFHRFTVIIIACWERQTCVLIQCFQFKMQPVCMDILWPITP